ncbi:helix-turn-helix domain-containing protein [Patulibacter sp. NPDC049589]|uniref:PucR family transcriptional regulator n=1 Tax=Patulibacter sp. NPDC049589 TaxID=3154731 RepID=UPI00342D92BD
MRLRHRHLVAPVQVEDERWGWLVVVEHPSRLTARDELTLRRAAAHVALELTSQRRAAGASWDARSTLARYLIRGSHDAIEVTQAAEYLGVAVGAPRVVAFVTEPGGPGGPVDVERLVAAMARHGAGDTLVTRGPEGAALLVEVAADDPASVAVGRVKRAVAAACDEVGGDGTIAGLSTVCRDPRAMPRAYREARESAHCVQGFAPRGRHRVLAADDLGPARIFVANGDTVAIDRFVDDTLGPLLGADEGVRDLVRTLGVFFELDRNVRGSAAELGIHENTIRYRLARVRSATGLDVAADANDQLTVQTALLVLRLRGHDALPPFGTGAERADGVEVVPVGTGA